MVITRILLWAALFAFCSITEAENTVTVASTFLAPGQAIPPFCQDEVAVWRLIIQQYPHPPNWNWYILCDDNTWNIYLQRSGQEALGRKIYGASDIDQGVTFLRGLTLIQPDSPEALPAHVIAHELAHIVLHSRDEVRVESLAAKWLAQQKKLSRALGASMSPGSNEVRRGN